MTTTTKRFLIGLIGRGRTGKNTVGTYLMNRHDFRPLSMTRPLYEALEILLPDPSCLDDDKKDSAIPGMSECGRELLQGLGDWARTHMGQDVLRKHAEFTMQISGYAGGGPSDRDYVITDLRTADEVLWLWERGGYVWHVRSSGAASVTAHHTEEIERAIIQAGERWRLMHPERAHLHSVGADWILTNGGTIEQLHQQVDQALAAIGAWREEAAE
jgi:hypothetical protein